jgi:integrase
MYNLGLEIKVLEIGNTLNLSDAEKIEEIMNYITFKYSDNSRPTIASLAKKIMLDHNLISVEKAEKINFKMISVRLTDERIKKLEAQETIEIKEDIFDTLISFRNSDVVHELYIYLLLITGLRFNELFTGNFSKIKGSLFIDKISKRSDSKTNFKIQLILDTPDEFLKLHQKFKSLNRLHGSAINRTVNRLLNKYELTSHKLRSIFLFYHLKVLKTGAERPTNIRVQNLLNHQTFAAGTFYENKFNISGVVDRDFNKTSKKLLKKKLNNRGINCSNTKGFNKLKKSELIALIKI